MKRSLLALLAALATVSFAAPSFADDSEEVKTSEKKESSAKEDDEDLSEEVAKKSESAKKEDVKKEDAKSESAKKEDVKKEDAKSESAKKEETSSEDVKKEDAKSETAKADEKHDEAKKDAAKSEVEVIRAWLQAAERKKLAEARHKCVAAAAKRPGSHSTKMAAARGCVLTYNKGLKASLKAEDKTALEPACKTLVEKRTGAHNAHSAASKTVKKPVSLASYTAHHPYLSACHVLFNTPLLKPRPVHATAKHGAKATDSHSEKADVKPAVKPSVKPGVKPPVKPAAKVDPKANTKSDSAE